MNANDNLTTWDKFVGSLPDDAQAFIADRTSNIKLPSRDHEIWQILEEALHSVLSDNPSPLDQFCDRLDATITVLASTTKLIHQGAQQVHDKALLLHPTKSAAPAMKLSAFSRLTSWFGSQDWLLPLIVYFIVFAPLVASVSFYGYTEAHAYGLKLSNEKLQRLDSLAQDNMSVIRDLSRIDVSLSLTPDPVRNVYWLHLKGINEITGQSDVPGGKAIIFR